jgi:hypothetical protein
MLWRGGLLAAVFLSVLWTYVGLGLYNLLIIIGMEPAQAHIAPAASWKEFFGNILSRKPLFLLSVPWFLFLMVVSGNTRLFSPPRVIRSDGSAGFSGPAGSLILSLFLSFLPSFSYAQAGWLGFILSIVAGFVFIAYSFSPLFPKWLKD